MEEEKLTKREKRELAREEKSKEMESQNLKKKLMKLGVGLLFIFGLAGGGRFFYREATKPLPGEKVADLGRDHVTDIAGIKYSSTPPTSGPHFPIWAKKGVYDRIISDGYLIHSLEHGYVILSYDCTKQVTSLPAQSGNKLKVKSVLAHDEPAKESSDSGELLKHMKVEATKGKSWVTPEEPPEVEVELPGEFGSESCKNLVTELSEFTKKWDRVIVVPRIDLETPIALTSWGRIDKLKNFDKNQIEEFIKSYHNKGPEKTME